MHLSPDTPRPRFGRAEAPGEPVAVAADPLLSAVQRAIAAGTQLPLTLLTEVPAQPGVLGPLASHLAERLNARRPWGVAPRLIISGRILETMAEAARQQQFDAALRYLHALLFPEAHAEVTGAVFLPLWNLDARDRSTMEAFRALVSVVNLAAVRREAVLHLVAVTDATRSEALKGEFDLVVPAPSLAVRAWGDAGTALAAALAGGDPPRERDLRSGLGVVRLERRYDEVTIDLRAPEAEGGKGLFGRFGQSKRDTEFLGEFCRSATQTIFRWDPTIQYLEVSLLREDRGSRRVVLEQKTERRAFKDVDRPD